MLRRLRPWQRWAIFGVLLLTLAPGADNLWWLRAAYGFAMPYGIVWAGERITARYFHRVGWVGLIGGTLNLIPIGWHDWWVAAGTIAGGLVAFFIRWWRNRKIRQKLAAGWTREKKIIAGMVRTMRERAPRLPTPVPVPT